MHLFFGIAMGGALAAGAFLCSRRGRYLLAQLLLLRRSMRREFERLNAGNAPELFMKRRGKKISLES